MRDFIRRYRNVLLLATVVSLALHWRIFHLELMGKHVWRQSHTQMNIRNFTNESMNILNPSIGQIDGGTSVHRMEFPVMQWCIAVVDRIFGYSVFISRLCMFLIGLLCMAGGGFFAFNFFRHDKAPPIFIWAFTFSPLFYYYTLNPLPDVAALGATLWGCGYFFRWLNTGKDRHLIFSGILLALGTLIKLPFIFYFGFILFAAFFQRKNGWKFVSGVLLKGMSWVLLPLAWYLTVIPQWVNNPVTSGVLDMKKKGVSDLLYYLWGNLSSSLPEMLINYAGVPLFIAGCWFIFRNRIFGSQKFRLSLIVSLLVLAYFIFELNLIALVHDYYLFPFLPLIFLIVTYGAINLWERKNLKYFMLFCLTVYPLTAFLRMDNRWDPGHPGFNKDLLSHADEIQRLIPAGDSIVTIGDETESIWFYYLNHKGWSYMRPVNMNYISDRVNDGARFIITDSKGMADTLCAGSAKLHITSRSVVGSFQILGVKR